MPSSQKYFYKLGHCSDLAVEEYLALSSGGFAAEHSSESSFEGGDLQGRRMYGTSGFEGPYFLDSYNKDWLLGQARLNVNLSGSLVFGGQVLSQIDGLSVEVWKQALSQALTQVQTDAGSKKIGLAIPKKFHSMALELAKLAGFKKVNLNSKLPNFGGWKSTKTWLVAFEFERQWFLGRILSYSNQEFWRVLDDDLPHGDIEEGIINLKLARSLLNLTNKEKVWDPFCGQGRLVVAGFDLKKEFLASDIQPELIPKVRDNLEKAEKIWNWGKGFLQTGFESAPEVATLALNARQLTKIDAGLLGNSKEIAIVTEGHLGKNFQSVPTKVDIETELAKLFDLWKEVLRQADKLGIDEIIFCLPLYLRSVETGQKWVWPKFQDKLVQGTCYRLHTFAGGKTNILYSRPKGFVGHLVVRVVQDQNRARF